MRVVLTLALVLLANAAQAQSLPKPKEFYFDTDAVAARPLVAIEDAQGDALADQLLKAMERGRKPVEATVQLARIAFESNRIDLGKSLYAQALDRAGGTNSGLGRATRWNYGWDLLRSGDANGALQQWVPLVETSLGGPSWIPPTLALALWQVDRRDEAVQWYAAAVRTEPALWNDAANYPQLLPDWRAQERDGLVQVLSAWQANPPAWP